MIPVPETFELNPSPTHFGLFGWDDTPSRSRLQPAHADASVLTRFRHMMAEDGYVVSLTRLCSDRLYAYECIAQAHSSASASLRAVALQLFESLESCDADLAAI